MFDSAAQNLSAPNFQLPADAYHHLIRTLRLALPPPPGNTPEDLARRDHAAIASIAALVPGNAVEAELAAQFVAASEQWRDCLRLAQLAEATPDSARKRRAQGLAMMRQANSALRLLMRLQERRRKLENDSAASNRVAWIEHVATHLMADALSERPETAPDRTCSSEPEKFVEPEPPGANLQTQAAPGISPNGAGKGTAPALPRREGQAKGPAKPAAQPEPAEELERALASRSRNAASAPLGAARARCAPGRVSASEDAPAPPPLRSGGADSG